MRGVHGEQASSADTALLHTLFLALSAQQRTRGSVDGGVKNKITFIPAR